MTAVRLEDFVPKDGTLHIHSRLDQYVRPNKRLV